MSLFNRKKPREKLAEGIQKKELSVFQKFSAARKEVLTDKKLIKNYEKTLRMGLIANVPRSFEPTLKERQGNELQRIKKIIADDQKERSMLRLFLNE